MALHEFRDPMIGHCVESGRDGAPPRAIIEIRPDETADVFEISLDPASLRALAASCLTAADSVEQLREGRTIADLQAYGEFGAKELTTADLPAGFRA